MGFRQLLDHRQRRRIFRQQDGFWVIFLGYLLPGPIGLICGILNLLQGRKEHGTAQLIFTLSFLCFILITPVLLLAI